MRRLQFHLSTLLIVCFIAGVLMWANFRNRGCEDAQAFISPDDSQLEEVRGYGFGWPFLHREYVLNYVKQTQETELLLDRTSHSKLAANIILSLAVVLVVALLLETAIKRKVRR